MIQSADCNPELVDCIASEIGSHGPIAFARFMELALYHPLHGYYNSSPDIIGRGGDYYTSLNLGPWFGWLMADQIAEMWQALGTSEQFRIIEGGAGAGLLCGDILSRLSSKHPACFAAASYSIRELSSAMKSGQQSHIGKIGFLEKVIWEDSHGDTESVLGVYVSNELADAFPVHIVEMTSGGLAEKYVEINDGKFAFINGPLSDPALGSYFERFGISLEPGYLTEINLAADTWMENIARELAAGFAITVDYGYKADRMYSPSRNRGTLMCYYKHTVSEDPLLRAGCQDITSHVNFSALSETGAKYGLLETGLTNQAFFLINSGLPALAAETPGHLSPQELLNRNFALKKLIDPDGLGKYLVLIQHKGFDEPPALSGLKIKP